MKKEEILKRLDELEKSVKEMKNIKAKENYIDELCRLFGLPKDIFIDSDVSCKCHEPKPLIKKGDKLYDANQFYKGILEVIYVHIKDEEETILIQFKGENHTLHMLIEDFKNKFRKLEDFNCPTELYLEKEIFHTCMSKPIKLTRIEFRGIDNYVSVKYKLDGCMGGEAELCNQNIKLFKKITKL
jgi:hypothetical protein